MKKTKARRGPARINAQEDAELHYWGEKFGVTKEEMRQAVAKAGTAVEAVRNQLAKTHPLSANQQLSAETKIVP